MNLSIGLCLLISFSTREYSILLTAFFYIISQPSLFFKKRGPAFPILLPPPSFSSPSSSSSNEPHNPFSMSGSPPHESADDAHGPGTAADPASNTGQYPIQYPGLLPFPNSPCLSSALPPPHSPFTPPPFIVPLNSDSQPVLQKLPLNAAEVALRARRTRSPELRPQR